MQLELPELKHIPNFGLTLLEKAQAKVAVHDEKLPEVTIKAVDSLIADSVFLTELVEDLSLMSTFLNKLIMRLEQKGGSYLKALGRESYESPSGVIQLSGKWAVRMPKDDEAKLALFDHLKSRGIFERYATVNSRSLQALYVADWKAACKKDPEAWVLFEMPGVPTPVFDEFTKIKGNGARRRKDNEHEHGE